MGVAHQPQDAHREQAQQLRAVLRDPPLRSRAEPHLLAEKDLTADELERFRELEAELLGLLHADTQARRGTFAFDEGPVTIICPEAPEDERGPLADPTNPNFNKLQRLADLDALMEIWGHVRAENPDSTFGTADRPRSSPTTSPATSSSSAASDGTRSPAGSRRRSARCRSPRSRCPS